MPPDPTQSLLERIVDKLETVSEQMTAFHVSISNHNQQLTGLTSALDSINSRLEIGQKSMENLREQANNNTHAVNAVAQRVDHVCSREQDHLNEVGKLWQFSNDQHTAITTINTRIGTAAAITTLLLAGAIGTVAYFGLEVINSAKALAVLEYRVNAKESSDGQNN